MTYVDGVNAEALDQWLGALESGNYTQGTKRLHTRGVDSMCCLGVAAAELGPKCGVALLDVDPEDHYGVSRYYLAEETGIKYNLLMPPEVTAYLGIPDEYIDHSLSGDVVLVNREHGDTYDDFYHRNGVSMVAVSTMNDAGAPFSEIARRIRETLTVKEA